GADGGHGTGLRRGAATGVSRAALGPDRRRPLGLSAASLGGAHPPGGGTPVSFIAQLLERLEDRSHLPAIIEVDGTETIAVSGKELRGRVDRARSFLRDA